MVQQGEMSKLSGHCAHKKKSETSSQIKEMHFIFWVTSSTLVCVSSMKQGGSLHLTFIGQTALAVLRVEWRGGWGGFLGGQAVWVWLSSWCNDDSDQGGGFPVCHAGQCCWFSLFMLMTLFFYHSWAIQSLPFLFLFPLSASLPIWFPPVFS